jgi:hypothetical protein
VTPYWIGFIAGLALLLVLAWLGLRGGKAAREQSVRFVCPHLKSVVDCRIVQDLRTGQWKRLNACSAFADQEDNTCDRECLRLANLGLLNLGLRRTG